MSEMVTVRRASAADLATLQHNEPRPGLQLSRKRLEEMTAGTGILAVALIDGQIVGSGFLDLADEELQPEVKNLWVYPQARRRGVGQALWTWLEARAREAGHQEVFLSVAPDNASAISLFVQLGYSPTGDHLVVEDEADRVVADPEQVATRYAIYRKSLRAY